MSPTLRPDKTEKSHRGFGHNDGAKIQTKIGLAKFFFCQSDYNNVYKYYSFTIAAMVSIISLAAGILSSSSSGVVS